MKNKKSVKKHNDKTKRMKDKQIVNRLLFAAVFLSLIIATFFVYDIVLLAIENEKESEPEIQIEAEVYPLYERPQAVHENLDNYVVSGQSSFLVHLSADGKYYTCSYKEEDRATVLDLLYKFSIYLGENDYVNYSTDSLLSPDMFVEVGRITYEEKTLKVEVPYKTEEIPVIFTVFANNVGKNKSGTPGEKEIKKRIKYVDGKEVETIVISEKVTKKPVSAKAYIDQSYLLDVGSGKPSDYITSIKCNFTSYTYADDGGLVTYTGDKTRVGYVAVDPKVIPLRSKLYIVLDNGFVYGYCYAMDIGGAIKGNIVDLFLPSTEDAKNLGRRSGTVYIVSYGQKN